MSSVVKKAQPNPPRPSSLAPRPSSLVPPNSLASFASFAVNPPFHFQHLTTLHTDLLYFLPTLLCVGFSVVIIGRQWGSLTRWALAIALLALGAESACSGLAFRAVLPREIGLWQVRALIAFSFAPAAMLLFSMSYARGHVPLLKQKWTWALTALIALPIGSIAFFSHELVALVTKLDEGAAWTVVLGKSGLAIQYATLIGAVFVLINLERTYRAAVGTMRWRIKFMTIGLAVLMFVRLYTSSQAALFNSTNPSLNLINSIGLLVACLLMLRTLVRSGHFEIEVYPSQAVIRNSLTIVVVGVYLVVVGLFAKLATLLGGDSAFPLKAMGVLVSLVLLALLLQSDRFRLNVRQFVSRHFQRPLYDYRIVWKRFTEETASQVTRKETCEALVKLIAEIFNALSVSIWLVSDDNRALSLKASTSIGTTGHRSQKSIPVEVAVLADQLIADTSVLDLDQSKADWVAAILEANPKQFENGGNRYLIPLVFGNQFLGVIILGDRHSGIPLYEQENDMLASVAIHSASALLNIQLSQKLYHSKELEAFQTMAAFFVHDLKNAASTLNIMVRNLPIHWDNPEFREDALRGITKTGDQINSLIGKLSELRHEVGVQLANGELNEFAQKTLTQWEAPATIELVVNLSDPIDVQIDSGQLHKVLLNLLLNAAESMDGAGRIAVSTKRDDGWAILEVEDNGCGISPDFLSKSLFRPFQTTKKRGLGIGMFQSKMIVEAHGGRITVESEEGVGTTFKVILPIETN